MTARVLTGSKQEIARKLTELEGEVREAIIFVEEPRATPPATSQTADEMFRQMEPYMARAGNVDYSRDAIYRRKPGE